MNDHKLDILIQNTEIMNNQLDQIIQILNEHINNHKEKGSKITDLANLLIEGPKSNTDQDIKNLYNRVQVNEGAVIKLDESVNNDISSMNKILSSMENRLKYVELFK